MEVLYRKPTPVYKGSQPQLAQPTGLRAELGAMFGGNRTPAYKTSPGAGAQASARTHGWRQVFGVTPSYKTASPDTDTDTDTIDPCVPPPDEGDGTAGSVCVCTSDEGRQVIVL